MTSGAPLRPEPPDAMRQALSAQIEVTQSRTGSRADELLDVLSSEIWPLLKDRSPITEAEREQAQPFTVDVVGAASLTLNGVDVGHDAAVQSFVIRHLPGAACITPTITPVTTDVTNAVLRRCGFI